MGLGNRMTRARLATFLPNASAHLCEKDDCCNTEELNNKSRASF